MTAGPSLQLDDRQVMQLHSAMVGAFSAVLHFLKRVSDDNKIQVGTVHVVYHFYLFIKQDFQFPCLMYRKRYCITFGVSIGSCNGGDVSKMLTLYIKVFYVTDKGRACLFGDRSSFSV